MALKLFICCLSFFYFSNELLAFNLDTNIPIVKEGKADSFFGFSVAQHIIGGLGGRQDRHVMLIGAPQDNVTDPNAANEVRELNRPGVLYSCPISSNLDDCIEVQVDRGAPRPEEDKNGQWLGVSVASQGTPEGLAVVCGHRFALHGKGYRWGDGVCITILNELDENTYLEACAGKQDGHSHYGFCQTGTAVDYSEDGDVLIGSPGPSNWRGAVFSITVSESLDSESVWYQSPAINPLPPPAEPTPEADVPYYSYMGMAAKIGKVLGETTYITGAPRSKDTGQVLLYKRDRKDNEFWLLAKPKHILSGEQFGSSFGYAVAPIDFNNDGYQDLVVSAPFYMEDRVGGIIYIYMNDGQGVSSDIEPIKIKSREMTGSECKKIDCVNARFGFSLENAGDLDRDGFEDLAVGAPYEEQGVVYIFRGSADGPITEYSQRIVASELLTAGSMDSFGYSLSGGIDMDDNGYPDLIVGAYHSNKALVLRSRPVVNVFSTMQHFPENIDPKVRQCSFTGKGYNCLKLQVCFKFTAEPANRFMGTLDLDYKVEAETFTGRSISRVFFKGSQNRNQNGHILESRMTMNPQGDGQYTCDDHIVYIRKDNDDFLRPLMFRLTFKLTPNPPPTMNPGQALPDINLYPILNEKEAVEDLAVEFKKDCGTDGICHSNLQLQSVLELDFDEDLGIYVLKLDQLETLQLNVWVKNNGEDAHAATLYVDIPDELSYRRVEGLKSSCIPYKNIVTCPLSNPMQKDADIRFTIKLDTKKNIVSADRLDIKLKVNTTSSETDEQDDSEIKSIKIISETDLLVRGSSWPSEVFFGGEVVGESAMVSEDDVGSMVTHNYEIKNQGDGSVANATVYIYWPYEVEIGYPQGKHLLYLMEEPQVDNPSKVKCYTQPGMVNPLGLEKSKEVIVDAVKDVTGEVISGNDDAVEGEKKKRSKRATKVVQYKTINERGRDIKVVDINCQDKSAKCHKIPCVLTNMNGRDSVVIYLRSRLWNSTFIEDYKNIDKVYVRSFAELVIDPKLNVKQTNEDNDRASATTIVVPDIAVQPKPQVQLWVIIVAACGGLLVLIIIIILLWKCGFFKRRKPDEMRVKGKVEKRKKGKKSSKMAYDDDYYS